MFLINAPTKRVYLLYRKRCHRCVVIYEKHKNVLQYKESECEDKDHFNPSALTSRSIIKSDENRGVAIASHPNMNGNSRLYVSSSDQFVNFRSNDDNDDCKQTRPKFFFSLLFLIKISKKQKWNQFENQNISNLKDNIKYVTHIFYY